MHKSCCHRLFFSFMFICLLSYAWPTLCISLVVFMPQFYVLLPPLHELILEIERDDIRGGELLNLLHKRCHCGVPELQSCIQRYFFWFYLPTEALSLTFYFIIVVLVVNVCGCCFGYTKSNLLGMKGYSGWHFT